MSRDIPSSSPSFRFRPAWLWPLAIAVLILCASHRPRLAGPSVEHIDKVTHFAVFGLLATLVCRLGSGWRAAVVAFILASAFGVLDEWHQSFVPGRTAELADWIADTLGAAVAVSIYSGWPWYRRMLETPLHRTRTRN